MNNAKVRQPHICPQHGDYSEYVRTVEFHAVWTDDIWYSAFYLCPTGGHEFDEVVEWDMGS